MSVTSFENFPCEQKHFCCYYLPTIFFYIYCCFIKVAQVTDSVLLLFYLFLTPNTLTFLNCFKDLSFDPISTLIFFKSTIFDSLNSDKKLSLKIFVVPFFKTRFLFQLKLRWFEYTRFVEKNYVVFLFIFQNYSLQVNCREKEWVLNLWKLATCYFIETFHFSIKFFKSFYLKPNFLIFDILAT